MQIAIKERDCYVFVDILMDFVMVVLPSLI